MLFADLRNRSQPEHAARPQIARARGERDQLAETKAGVSGGVELAEAHAVPVNPHADSSAAVAPGFAQFVRRHRDRSECSSWFGEKKTELLFQVAGTEIAQRPVVHQHQKPHMLQRVVTFDTHRHVAGDHRDFCLEVDAVLFFDKRHVVVATEKVVGAALVDQRFAR